MKTVHLKLSGQASPRKSLPGKKRFAKRRYLFLLFLFSLILNILFTSCDNDGYSLGDWWADYAVVHKTDNELFTLTTDQGAVLFPSASAIPSDYLNNNDRVLVNFTILGDADSTSPYDYYVKVNDVYKILTKDILDYTPSVSDSLGNDPIFLNEIRVRNGFITLDFFFGGSLGGPKHMVNMARHPLLTPDKRIVLDFRHNAFGDPHSYNYRSLVAFPINNIIDTSQDSVQLRVLYNGYEKEEKVDLTWRAKENPMPRNVFLHQDQNLPDKNRLR